MGGQCPRDSWNEGHGRRVAGGDSLGKCTDGNDGRGECSDYGAVGDECADGGNGCREWSRYAMRYGARQGDDDRIEGGCCAFDSRDGSDSCCIKGG